MIEQLDVRFMGNNVGKKLKKCGKGVVIYPLAKIVDPEMVEIDDYSVIDDYTFIQGGNGRKIGKYCHIPAFSSIIGRGKFEMGHCSALTAGCRVITGTDDYHGGTFMSASCPDQWRNPKEGNIKVGPGAFIGTNSVLLADVTIGECAVVGAQSFINKDLEPYGIYVGCPAKKIGYRDELKPEILEDLEEHGINVFVGKRK